MFARRSPTVGAGIATLAVAVLLVGYPIGRLVAVVVEQGAVPLRAAVSAPGFKTALLHTLVVGLVVSALAVPAGTLIALALRRREVPGRTALRVMFLLPLLVPQFVLGFSWSQAYGPAGLSDEVVGVTIPHLLGALGVCLVLAVSLVPLVVLIVSAGLAARAEPDFERAARAAGASGFQALLTITLPLLRGQIVAAFALVFVGAVDSFAVPAALGTPGGFSTMTTQIYADLNLASEPSAFTDALVLSLALAVIAVLGLAPAGIMLARSGPQTRTEQAFSLDATASRGIRPRLIAAVLWLYLALTVAVPLLALVLSALDRAVGLTPTPGNWTLANFREALAGPTLSAFGHSVLLAASAACVALVLGGFLAALQRLRAGRLVGWGIMFAFALPGSVLAVGVILAYGRLWGGTLFIILIAYLAKLWALAHRPIVGALDRLSPEEVRAARACGAGGFTAWRTVRLPPLTPALASGWLLVFLFAMHELTMSSLLYGPSSQTLAIVVLNLQQLGSLGATSALAVLLTLVLVLGSLPLLLIRRLSHGASQAYETKEVEVAPAHA